MATIGYVRNNATTKAQSIIDMLEDTLTRHGAYTKVATVTSATAQPCSVWKSSGTRNALGRDWYFLIARTVGTNPPDFSIAVAEGFDQASGSVIRPAPGSGRSVIPADDGSYGGGIAYPIWSGSYLNSSDLFWLNISVASQTYDDYAIITNDTITITHWYSSTASIYHAGVAESFRNDIESGVLGLTADSGGGSITRMINVRAAYSANWALTSLGATWTPVSGQAGGAGDRIYDMRPVASRLQVKHSGIDRETGVSRGLWRNVLYIPTANDVYTAGDKLFVNNDTYQYAGGRQTNIWVNTTPT